MIDQLLCLFAILVALFIFMKVTGVLTSHSKDELKSKRERNRLINALNKRARTDKQLLAATLLGLALVFKGTGRAAYIAGGLGLAVAMVGGGCPSMFQIIAEALTKWLGSSPAK